MTPPQAAVGATVLPPADHAVVQGANWAGYLASADLVTAYVGVRASFVQPAAARACWPEADALTWVGLGGYHRHGATRALIQVGTTADIDIMSGVGYWAWYQFLRTDLVGNQLDGSEQVRLPITVSPGDRIHLSVTAARSTGLVAFEVRNATTGARVRRSLAVSPEFVDPTSAELISERTRGVRLARFGSVTWRDGAVQRADGGWQPLASQPLLTRVVMAPAGRTALATPDELTAHSSFTTRWSACT